MSKPTLEQFVHDLTDITSGKDYANEEELTGKVATLLQELVVVPGAIPEQFTHRDPEQQRSARYMLHRSPLFTVSSIVWAPGAVAKPHNHETWGAIGVVSNRIEERRYRLAAESGIEPTDHFRHGIGAVSELIPDDDIHSMHNLTEADTVEIHVYGRDLTDLKRKTWLDSGEMVEFASDKYLNC